MKTHQWQIHLLSKPVIPVSLPKSIHLSIKTDWLDSPLLQPGSITNKPVSTKEASPQYASSSHYVIFGFEEDHGIH